MPSSLRAGPKRGGFLAGRMLTASDSPLQRQHQVFASQPSISAPLASRRCDLGSSARCPSAGKARGDSLDPLPAVPGKAALGKGGCEPPTGGCPRIPRARRCSGGTRVMVQWPSVRPSIRKSCKARVEMARGASALPEPQPQRCQLLLLVRMLNKSLGERQSA